ncbi:hypothetical protein [Methylosinus sp. PW1]|uniref:hypothetical protein n=1 Tax=Methylosinus sp. PW1 TaxID=107636 RepID=UPI00055D097C|nr:hypothetical protein [Methylosinus sp. PW1]
MTSITETAFATLEEQKRLLSPVHKGPTEKAGRFGFRGKLALKFAQQFADEARPPELCSDQVIAVAEAGKPTFDFFAQWVLSFEHLGYVAEVLKGLLAPDGKYFIFANNIDLLSKYQVEIDGINFYVLPIDESTVYNELLELFYIEKNDLKKLSIGGKIDAVANAGIAFDQTFEKITFEKGLEVMGPVRNRNENRPV